MSDPFEDFIENKDIFGPATIKVRIRDKITLTEVGKVPSLADAFNANIVTHLGEIVTHLGDVVTHTP